MERLNQLKSNLQNIMNDFSGKVGIIVKVDGKETFFKNNFVDLIILAEGENKEAILLNNRLGECIYENFKKY